MKGETEKREGTRTETPARVPYIGKSAKKLKCWRPERKQCGKLLIFAVHVANGSEF